MTAALLPVSPWLRPECLTQFACQMMLWAGSASFTLPCIYVQQRVSQEGQIKWTRPMETQACLWCKSPARMFIALIGEKLWLFQTTDDLGSRYSLHFCVHPNRPDIHSFISCCNHSLALSFTGVCFFSPPKSCSEDGYQGVFSQSSAAGTTLHGCCPFRDPEPFGCSGEKLLGHQAGVLGEGVQHKHRSADSNFW